MLQALASLVRFNGEGNEERQQQVMDSIQDIAGTVYKYSTAASVLKGRIDDAH
jgi:hypothetical protein